MMKLINFLKNIKKSQFKAPIGSAIAKDFKIGNYSNLQFISWKEILIEDRVEFREFCNLLLMKDSVLKIGKNVFFNNYCSINCLERIEIGENTLFGEGVKIYDHNHVYNKKGIELKVERNEFSTSPVKIGKNCWIGSNVTILKGVSIGDNVIIGAHCLIYKPIPSNVIIKHEEKLSEV